MAKSKCKQLHDLIHAKEILAMPGAYDAVSAKLIALSGFKACQITGFGVAASMFGLPDIGILALRDQVNVTQWISQAVDIPVISDGDTGYGNSVNVYHTVKQLEAAGAAGVNLEDQDWPKRCGHMDGKHIITMEEMVQKIKAAIKSRTDPFFVINARTDAIAVAGIDEAIKRGNAYAKAGANLIFMEAPRTIDDIKHIVNEIDAPVSINMLGTSGGKTPAMSLKALEEIGVARVSFPLVALSSAVHAMQQSLLHLKEQGNLQGLETELAPFSVLESLVDMPFNIALDQEFSN